MKTNAELINDYKKSNKVRREKIALAAGFTTGDEYFKSLTTVKSTKKVRIAKKVSKMKGIFYVVDILDATGSMDGSKYTNSKEGIIAGIKDMATRKDVKYSLVEFIQASKPLHRPITNQAPSEVKGLSFSGANGSDTPLYWAVWEVITKLQTQVTKDDKVLIKVYTDGGNNSKREYITLAAELIKQVQKENFTVTFVATPSDLEMIKRDINIHDSNTLATENTGKGFKMSMEASRGATMAYFANSISGEDTLVGFYKKEGVL